MLVEAGMEKINFSGGEPFLHKSGKYLGELVRYCKEELVTMKDFFCGFSFSSVQIWFIIGPFIFTTNAKL